MVNPVLRLLTLPRRIHDKIRRHNVKKDVGGWFEDSRSEYMRREYTSYEDYVKHQRLKLDLKSICAVDLKEYDEKYHHALRERLQGTGLEFGGRNALCLAARLGTEVKAFLDMGCFAVGIDLNPGKDNPYVITGDFHNLVFPDASVDFVFTNSLDHVYEIERLIAEIVRVLKDGAYFIAEVDAGMKGGAKPGFYESFFWKDLDQLLGLFEAKGLQVEFRQEGGYPWNWPVIGMRKKPQALV